MKTQPPQTDPSAGTQAEVKLHIQDGGLWLVTMGTNQTIGYIFDQGACYSALPCDEYLALPSWDNRPVEEYDVIARGSVKTCVDALVARANNETWPTGLLAMFERFAQLSSPRLVPNTYHSTPEAAIERTHLLTNIPEEIKRLEAFADLGADKLMGEAAQRSNLHPVFGQILSRHLAGRTSTPPPATVEPASTLVDLLQKRVRVLLDDDDLATGEELEAAIRAELETWPQLAAECAPERPKGTPASTEALEAFCATIEDTGGILMKNGAATGCEGDPDWLDLADAYLLACDVLGREPKTDECDDGDEEEERCPAVSGKFRCTLGAGHVGDHQAADSSGRVVGKWRPVDAGHAEANTDADCAAQAAPKE